MQTHIEALAALILSIAWPQHEHCMVLAVIFRAAIKGYRGGKADLLWPSLAVYAVCIVAAVQCGGHRRSERRKRRGGLCPS